jgi:mono/diheme cytochrome c family protein
MRRNLTLLVAGVLLGTGLAGARAAEADALRGYAVARKYCAECHGERRTSGGLDLGNRDLLLKKGEPPYVVPGHPESSYLWQRVQDGEMPPKSRPQPSDEEKLALRGWVAAGAPFPQKAERVLLGDRYVLAAIVHDLNRLPAPDRRWQRYFTLVHLYNNPGVSDAELHLHAAALSKAINSLSWARDIVVPRAVDPAETVYAVDLRRIGWQLDDRWDEVLADYPYGLRYGASAGALADVAREVRRLAGTDRVDVRADWFVTAATQPPLYHKLLGLPNNAGDLERLLGIDFKEDFRSDRLARAAVIQSGVSRNNRVVERQATRYGAYWKSYDFRTSAGDGNVARLPLGPDFKGNPFADLAFRQAGGEIVFNLPNGLQGYLLIDSKGKRLDRAPADIVEDSLKTAGSGIIVNGVSCMACHKNGVVSGFHDVIRNGHGLTGAAAVKVGRLYAEPAVMDRLLREDEGRFLKALDRAVGPFLRAGADRGKKVRDLPEPVGPVVRRYLRELDAGDAACELGLRGPSELTELMGRRPELRDLGMGPLLEGAKIKREVWERTEGTSLYQEASRLLGRGTPVVELKAR